MTNTEEITDSAPQIWHVDVSKMWKADLAHIKNGDQLNIWHPNGKSSSNWFAKLHLWKWASRVCNISVYRCIGSHVSDKFIDDTVCMVLKATCNCSIYCFTFGQDIYKNPNMHHLSSRECLLWGWKSPCF